jgi:hypothetical protein
LNLVVLLHLLDQWALLVLLIPLPLLHLAVQLVLEFHHLILMNLLDPLHLAVLSHQ